ncbi:acyl-CoA dehydrogenase family protein [Amycolatopsis sp. lyj-112]|uniref:acyl-CoA dehydrogenase family protein n=1 Tax=Amycolatopsis sp. lyj-112 TaxID=2789288 RepID=UPI00397D69DC
MANTASGQNHPLPPEPGLTPDEVVARAEAIAATLVERQAEVEERTYYAQDVHEAFAEAGFYRILVPRRYGGYEFGVDTFVRVTMALTRGCSSTGWMYCLGAAHALLAATLFDERAQAELFAGGDFIAPLPLAPGGTAERTDDGHWVLNGTWNYCSGAPYATHLMAHAMVSKEDGAPPEPLLFVIPRSEWEMLDNWGNQLGLKGSGSHSITIRDGRIPDHFTKPLHLSEATMADGEPGLQLHGNPQYSGAPLGFMSLEGAAIAVGMAKGALDAYEELLRTKTTITPPFAIRSEDPDYQLWYGEAAALIATGEAALHNAVQQWDELCAGGAAAYTPDRDLMIALICRQAATIAWRGVETRIVPTAGSSAMRNGERLERVWRDLSTGLSHVGFGVVLAGEGHRSYTRAHVNGEWFAAGAA